MEAEIVAALEALFLADERWKYTPFPAGTMVQRDWDDGTVDTIILLSPATAYADRVTPDRMDPPWSILGSAKAVVDAAREVLAPDDPNAPKASDGGLPPGERR
jgi:hypothetical protein